MPHKRVPGILATVAIGLLIAACSTSNPAPTVTPAGSSASPPVAPSVAPTPSPTGPVGSPRPSDPPPSARPSPSPAPSFTAAERRLVDALRVNARVACAPRRTELPTGANAGVECHVNTALVDRVGVYSFGPSANALDTYLARLATARVQPRTGDCGAGKPGDHSWPGYLPDESEDGSAGNRAERSGCFLDENGIANIRLTCYGDIYMGVLGTTADIAALYKWAWRVADGEGADRDPPGLCAAPD